MVVHVCMHVIINNYYYSTSLSPVQFDLFLYAKSLKDVCPIIKRARVTGVELDS